MVRVIQSERMAQFNANSTSNGATCAFGSPAEIVQVKIISDSVGTVNTATNIRVDRYTIAGNSSSGVTSAYCGTFVIPASSTQGSVFYQDLSALKELKVEAGDELVFVVANASTDAHLLRPIIEYVHLDEQIANITDAVSV